MKLENKENSIDDENVNNEWWKWMIFECSVCTNQLKCETKKVGCKEMKCHEWCKFLLWMLFIEQMIYQSYAHKMNQAMYTIHSLMDEYAQKLNS